MKIYLAGDIIKIKTTKVKPHYLFTYFFRKATEGFIKIIIRRNKI
jgi:hypothetical protein